MKNWQKFFVAVIMCELAGVVGSIFTASAIPTWYASLVRPTFSPPNWIFGPVWITLYFLMGVALFLIWQKGLKDKKNIFAFRFFISHLFINSIWSIIFFGLQNPLWAFFDIILLWFMIAVLIIKFSEIDKRAAYLLVPYMLWVSFASVLNFAIFVLN